MPPAVRARAAAVPARRAVGGSAGIPAHCWGGLGETSGLPQVAELITATSPSKFLGSRGLGITLFKVNIVFLYKEH